MPLRDGHREDREQHGHQGVQARGFVGGGSDGGFIANKGSISRDFRHSASDEQVKTFALSVSGRISTIGVGALAKDKLGDGIEKLPKPRIFGGVRGVSGIDTGK